MAKQFYNKDEVQQKLGCDEAEIKKLVQEGKLREFLDGAKKIYKSAEVDQLSKELLSDQTGEISLSPEGTGIELAPLDDSDGIPLRAEEPKAKSKKGAPSLSDDSSGEIGLAPLDTGSGMDLAPLGEEDLLADDSGKHSEIAKKGAAASGSFGDIGLAPLGESGTGDKIRLDDTSSQGPDKDDTVITSHGVNVLDDSDSLGKGFVDPMAQTQMAPDLVDQIHLDSGSSGSGLLDLTREADDTSLGAELLEEIYPGADQDSQGAIETQVPTGLDIVGEESSSILAQQMGPEDGMLVSYAKRVEVYDPTSGAYGAALVVPLLFLGYLACVAMAGAMDLQPALLTKLSGNTAIIGVFLGGAILSLMVALVGRMILSPKESAMKPKAKKAAAKPKKEVKVKAKKEKKDKKAK